MKNTFIFCRLTWTRSIPKYHWKPLVRWHMEKSWLNNPGKSHTWSMNTTFTFYQSHSVSYLIYPRLSTVGEYHYNILCTTLHRPGPNLDHTPHRTSVILFSNYFYLEACKFQLIGIKRASGTTDSSRFF